MNLVFFLRIFVFELAAHTGQIPYCSLLRRLHNNRVVKCKVKLLSSLTMACCILQAMGTMGHNRRT